jgi:hypothetical protein
LLAGRRAFLLVLAFLTWLAAWALTQAIRDYQSCIALFREALDPRAGCLSSGSNAAFGVAAIFAAVVGVSTVVSTVVVLRRTRQTRGGPTRIAIVDVILVAVASAAVVWSTVYMAVSNPFNV